MTKSGVLITVGIAKKKCDSDGDLFWCEMNFDRFAY